MEAVELKICYYRSESHIHLGVLRKAMRMRNVCGAIGIFTRYVLSIPSGKILNKHCESLYW